MRNAHDLPENRSTPFPRIAALAAVLGGCGDVTAPAMPDAPAPPQIDAPGMPADAPVVTIDGAVNRCAPGACLLADEFDGASLNPSLWGEAVEGGATVTVKNGTLSIHLPAAAEAGADVYSLVGFPTGTTFMASVTFTPGQFYDHKGVGFSSSKIGSDCFSGETDAAMVRGQDGDSYIETKLAGTATCNLIAKEYPAGVRVIRIDRDADQVTFIQNDVELGPVKTRVPSGLLPIHFTAYTYQTAPQQSLDITVDWVAVMRR